MHKVVLYLMNKRGLEVLKTLIEKYSADIIEYVVLSRDPAVQNDYFDELSLLCVESRIKHFNKDDNYPKYDGYKFAIGWRWMISDCKKLIVLHDSILPKYRGFSPLVNMLINGEREIGVTAFFANEDFDRGPIILQNKMEIRYPIKISEAIDLISTLYQKIVCEVVDKILNEESIIRNTQNEDEASYSVWRNEEDYFIDWSQNADVINRTIDALGYPYSGAKTNIKDEIIVIEEAEVIEDVVVENRDVGKVLFIQDSYPVIICGVGLLKLKKARSIDGNFNLSKIKFRTRFGGKHY
ncbi:methionyl-tRNA formyltransferase [Soehngenia saccharolytica]|nr:methionyl-tRNA formyltransferase [Soehngenia saccharolytica]